MIFIRESFVMTLGLILFLLPATALFRAMICATRRKIYAFRILVLPDAGRANESHVECLELLFSERMICLGQLGEYWK
jgi:hypothetical protein